MLLLLLRTSRVLILFVSVAVGGVGFALLLL